MISCDFISLSENAGLSFENVLNFAHLHSLYYSELLTLDITASLLVA